MFSCFASRARRNGKNRIEKNRKYGYTEKKAPPRNNMRGITRKRGDPGAGRRFETPEKQAGEAFSAENGLKAGQENRT